uniref:Glycine rich superfamily member n=1 Tax=Rhipicephalus appendiculatus TaxID=34631 RepID=A0A131YAS7_RHIAP
MGLRRDGSTLMEYMNEATHKLPATSTTHGRNDTLVMEQLVVNITEAVHVSVTPIGTVSSVVAFFLPPKFLAEMIKRNIHQLMNSTIQSGLDSLYTFAHGNASGA